MCPDDLDSGVVPEQDLERRVVAVRMQPEPPLDGERDDPPHPRRVGIATEHVELSDATVADVTRELGLDQRIDLGIVEPRLAVGVVAVRADERHDPRSGAGVGLRRGHQRARAVVRTAGREDGDHATFPEQPEDIRDGMDEGCLVVVVQVRVEDRQQVRRPRGDGAEQRGQRERQPEHASRESGPGRHGRRRGARRMQVWHRMPKDSSAPIEKSAAEGFPSLGIAL